MVRVVVLTCVVRVELNACLCREELHVKGGGGDVRGCRVELNACV